MNSGYGSSLTRVSIINDTTLKKEAISNYGKKRIKKEILFYKKLKESNINFPVPEFNQISEFKFNMEYLSDYITYQEYLNNGFKINKKVIFDHLKNLHANSIKVSEDEFKNNLQIETYGKVEERYSEIKDIIDKYNYIKIVNGIEILDFTNIINFIKNFIKSYEIPTNNHYSLIHGDLQLNNILINPNTNDLKFIDPKGYFGNLDLFGMTEYDFAKFYFGLGGYSNFDMKEVNNLNIKDNEIIINIEAIEEIDLKQINLVNIFIISIWLGNAHCFKDNELKVVESFFYALYISTKLIKRYK